MDHLCFVSCVAHTFASVHCCIVVTCCERADSWLLLVIFIIFLLLSPCGILGQVWYLIVSFHDLCWLSYFGHINLAINFRLA